VINSKDHIATTPVQGFADRAAALSVLHAVYVEEKGWVGDLEDLLPEEDLGKSDVSWFLCRREGRAVGVVRVLFELPLERYREYGLRLLAPGTDVEAFLRRNRIAEVGRFAVLDSERGQFMAAASLIRAAALDALTRRCTHLITDVFENDPNSPYAFHTRVLGFVPVATHDHGELRSDDRRITMLLDLKASYERLRQRGGWIFRYIFEGWSEDQRQRLMAVET
jgi:hypothetical protein